MPILEAILFFCENCHTVSQEYGVCPQCERVFQSETFVPKEKLSKVEKLDPTIIHNLIEACQFAADAIFNKEYTEEAMDVCFTILAQVEAAKQIDKVSVIPCSRCGGEVEEFVIPNDIWNKVIRNNGPESDNEYICVNCWFSALRKSLGMEIVL